MQIDLDDLLQPIREDAPSGEDISFSRELDLIQDARREDDATLDQGDWVTDLKEANWPSVVKQTSDLLRSRTKDIRLAVWLTEALAKTEGFGGLASGFKFTGQLAERYWQDLYPLPEDGDSEQRIGNLAWLATRTAQLVRTIPITQASVGTFSFVDYEAARALQAAVERDPEHTEPIAEDKITLQRFQAAQRKTPTEFYVQLLQDLAACNTALQNFSDIIDKQLGIEGPSFAPLRESLAEVENIAQRFAREAGVGAAVSEDTEEEPGNAAETGTTPTSGSVRTRAQALRQLRVVADFFRRTEPHSPVAYLADKAARWGEMPLDVWLRTVVKDAGAMAHLEELLGLENATRRDEDEGH